jgi:NitT/TauT family transport system permease protein
MVVDGDGLTAAERPGLDAIPDSAGGEAVASQSSRTGHWATVYGLRVLAIAAVAGAWQITAATKAVNPLFIGLPSSIVQSLWDLLHSGFFWTDVGVTLEEVALGFSIGAALGLMVGILFYLVPILYSAFRPLLVGLNTAPRVAFAPLFVLWFGLGEMSKIAMGISIAFFIVFESAYTGLLQPERENVLLARTLGYSRLRQLRLFILPGAVPVIANGLQLALVYTVGAVVVGEFVGGVKGLGVLLDTDVNTFQTNQFFAAMLVLILLTVFIAQAMKAVEYRILRWHVIEMRGTR